MSFIYFLQLYYLCKVKSEDILAIYRLDERTSKLKDFIRGGQKTRIHLKGLVGSVGAVVGAAVFEGNPYTHLFILPDKESAAYFLNDLENLFDEQNLPSEKKRILFYPTSYKKAYEIEKTDNANVLLRTDILNRLSGGRRKNVVVTYPEALSEKVVTHTYLTKNTFKLKTGEQVNLDFIMEFLAEYGFERVDFVVEPGQFTLRGGIVDVFSYSNDYPYRIEFAGNMIDSLRTFDPETQLSVSKLSHISLLPDVQNRAILEKRESLLSLLANDTIIWIDDLQYTSEKINKEFEKAETAFVEIKKGSEINHQEPKELFISGDEFLKQLPDFAIIEFGRHFRLEANEIIDFEISPQPLFSKNFELLISDMQKNTESGIKNYILAENNKQVERIYTIFDDIQKNHKLSKDVEFMPIQIALHEGFVDKNLKIAVYTDHQIFERFQRFRLRDRFAGKEIVTMKELYDLKPGDYITHIDHGVGRFDGLEKIPINGKEQEAIRLVYKDNDLLYVSIHSLHRISKFVGKDGTEPTMNRLGSNAWNNLKQKTKQRVKDIAKDLIKLYAERRAEKGFAFVPDTYLQTELEASFIYEDTPDQIKSTLDVKKDMEADFPMDRLICGDVGFGKTEIAIRAAFKAVTDSKQVAVLVPTTILALQHYKTFSERLKNFPCKVDYLNRFKSPKAVKKTLEELKNGTLDILIGTHRLISKDVEFKDLGLLVIDEEQKFGVASKEKLKQLKVNVDTLTLTATPIPRTLQFSLMGARDLSIINTPPPNRYPIITELHVFKEEVIRDAIMYEVSRGGQVFFINNRVNNILEVAGMVQRLCPDVRISVGHGQLEGHKLEQIMLEFIEGDCDVLIATTIVESGLDIPNANTIIINNAQNYGLSDLHQLRGRVGRANRKAFCYLLAPPLSVLSDEARKRLRAIEEFSDLGSGFNIAMRDLDIRGAGNLLGGEQSGFITDIGFEMYHKILDEAIQELKETDFKEYFKVTPTQEFVKDCQIETDLEILIPDDYINSAKERLFLYKELDSIETEEGLDKFRERLIDRFGPIPMQTQELINAVNLRRIAKEIGFEKLVLKGNKMIGFFISNQDSPYYQSESFTLVLNYVQKNPKTCRMKEGNNKLTLAFENIESVNKAISSIKILLKPYL
ncbi:MAG: transcription-repair coupling factor, partial [Bacteroidetes bacterium]|nr:transcription-repair coupling factor [Bacteroidota bacterium]